MSLPEDLLAKLACPKCRGELHHDESRPALECMACRLRFAIDDGIPNLLEDEATPMASEGVAAPEPVDGPEPAPA